MSAARVWSVAVCALLSFAACSGEIGLPEDGPADESGLVGVDEDRDAIAQGADRSTFSAVVGKLAQVVRTGGVGLRLRSGPSTGHTILLVMPEGALAQAIGGPSSGWYKLRYKERVGWSHGAYLTPASSGSGSSSGGGTSGASAQHRLLPYEAGSKYRLTCGHGCYGHVGWGYWAWDFGMPQGTPVVAVHAGTVRAVKGWSRTGGCSSAYAAYANYVVLAKGDGTESLYLHLSSTVVSAGQRVARGQLLGYSGSTGWACGAHLHLQIQRSPVGGSGGSGSYNPSVRAYFYDTGKAYDPRTGDWPLSRNSGGSTTTFSFEPDADASASASAERALAEQHDQHAATFAEAPLSDFHGGLPGEYDRVMRQIGELELQATDEP